jgi:hypothetical protein
MSPQSTLRSTFRQKNQQQQTAYHFLKDEPEKVMQALLDRYLFLAMVESGEYSEDELSLQLIEGNASLAKAIDINNAIARRHGIDIFDPPSTTADPPLAKAEKKNQHSPPNTPASSGTTKPKKSVESDINDQMEF